MLECIFKCDGCGAETRAAQNSRLPPIGWMQRTMVDVSHLDGPGLRTGASEVERIRHYCRSCKVKVAA